MNFNAIIGKQVAYGSGLSADDKYNDVVANLAVGAVVIMQQGGASHEGAILTAGGVDTTSDDFFIVAKYANTQYPNGIVVKSPPMARANAVYAYVPRTAHKAKELHIGKTSYATTGTLNLPTLSVGQVYELVYTDIEIGGQRERFTKRISEVVGEVDTELTVVTRLVAHFNREVNRTGHKVTATINATATDPLGISFVGNKGENYTVTPIQVLGYATFKEKPGYTKGAGNNVQILKCEQTALVEDGKGGTYSAGERNVWTEASQVLAGVDYIQHILRWSDTRKGEVSNKETYNQTFKLCAPATGTHPNVLVKAILEALL